MNFKQWVVPRHATFACLVVCLFSLFATGIKTAMAYVLAEKTVESYAPSVERQALTIIVQSLPGTESGRRSAALAEHLAASVERQYAALSQAVQMQASALAWQTFGWALASVLALFAHLEFRRKVASAA